MTRSNGRWLRTGEFSWQRTFCDPDDDIPEVREGRMCQFYRDLSDFTGAVQTSPQWWVVRMDPSLLAGSRVLSLMLAGRPNPRESAGARASRLAEGAPPSAPDNLPGG